MRIINRLNGRNSFGGFKWSTVVRLSHFLSFLVLQGSAYITCMPGPVRRWNYPAPLCLGTLKSPVGHCPWSFQQQQSPHLHISLWYGGCRRIWQREKTRYFCLICLWFTDVCICVYIVSLWVSKLKETRAIHSSTELHYHQALSTGYNLLSIHSPLPSEERHLTQTAILTFPFVLKSIRPTVTFSGFRRHSLNETIVHLWLSMILFAIRKERRSETMSSFCTGLEKQKPFPCVTDL